MKFIRKELMFPIFIKVSQLCKNAFWMYLYDDLAHGVCPHGAYIDTRTMSVCSKLKGKQFNFVFAQQDPQYIYLTLTNLFSSKLNIYSHMEILHQRDEFDAYLHLSCTHWKDIRKVNIKNILLQNFVLYLYKKYRFTMSHSRRILSIINMAFLFKLLSPSDVVYDSETSSIVDIHGLDFESILEHQFKIPLKPVPNCQTDKTNTKSSVKDSWHKFIGEK